MLDQFRDISRKALLHLSERGQQLVDRLYDLSVDKSAIEAFSDRLTLKQRRELTSYLVGAQHQVNGACVTDEVRRALIALAFVQVAADNPRTKVFIPIEFFRERGIDLYYELKNLTDSKDFEVKNDYVRFVGSPDRDDMRSLLRGLWADRHKKRRVVQETIDQLVQKPEDLQRKREKNNG